MSKILIYFPSFTNECSFYDKDDKDDYDCKHPENDQGCFESACPFVILPSLADLKQLDEELYKEYKHEFEHKFKNDTFGYIEDDEEELLPIDLGCEWVLIEDH